MSDAYTNLLVHVVFSTKKRERRLTAAVRKQLYPYLVALAKECQAEPHAVNGGLDHIHLLIRMPPNSTVSDLIKFLKANSSRWIRSKFDRQFQWQIGCAALSVSRSNFAQVCAYIDRQEEHHKRMSFEDEFVTLLERNEIGFENERLWNQRRSCRPIRGSISPNPANPALARRATAMAPYGLGN